MKRIVWIGLSFLVCLLAACARNTGERTEAMITENGAAQAGTELPTTEPIVEASPAPTAEPAPDSQPVTITVGAVGDIMVVPLHLAAAHDEETDTYDFSFSFQAVSEMFRDVDVMCGNLEGTLPGDGVDRYSSRQIGGYGVMRFGAPDSFAKTLVDTGFNFISTANNHAADYGADGIRNTIDVLEANGLAHAGTFRSAEERQNPCVLDVNGIRVGFVAGTTVFNEGPGITEAERNDMLVRFQFPDRLMEDIANCKAAGAELIVMFAHWEMEYVTKTATGTKTRARQLFEAGVDIIFGAHPHVVQMMEYMTVTRADGTEHECFVAYSLGNFYSNEGFEASCGLYAQVEVTKDTDGRITVKNAGYMPLYCLRRDIDEVPFHQVVPALADTSRIGPFYGPINEQEAKLLKRARDYVIEICRTDTVPIMEDICWRN